MTSNFKEDQAEQLRKQFNGHKDKEVVDETVIDVLSLPSRKEKYQNPKQKNRTVEVEKKISSEERIKKKKRKRRVRFPLIRILLLLFLMLVILVTTYPIWIERLNL